ncbi:desmoglein-2.1-like [Aplochiton taeniatus]
MVYLSTLTMKLGLIILLSCDWAQGGTSKQRQLRRHRREWVIPAQSLKENVDYTKKIFVAKIRSDMDINAKMYYSLIGVGANLDPVNLFVVGEDTGLIRIRGILDREERDSYLLTGVARYRNGTGAEDRIDLKITVEDENDNPPVFGPVPEARVKEMSPTGTTTLKVVVVDINDNTPYLDKDQYSGNIMENIAMVEVMRFQALDSDEENTDNWVAVFDIVSGNEDGIFSITTDPKTNEGVLILEKPVDFEQNPNIQLGVTVTNNVPVVQMSGDGEPPAFKPLVKPVAVSENPAESPVSKVITVYPAIDETTGKPAENVNYLKGLDPGNWISIDPKTAEIKLRKVPDRESPFLKNGIYYAQVLCMTNDDPAKTSTGTIALQVGDSNDNCPELTSTLEYVCTDTESVNVTAQDVDGEPNGAPFHFSLVPEETRGQWGVDPLNDTSASLKTLELLWPGVYDVALVIQDQQGMACPHPQKLRLEVCTCSEGQTSPILLLFSCNCGAVPQSFTEFHFDTKEHLISYHTEGQGEDREVPVLPVALPKGAVSATELQTTSHKNHASANNVTPYMTSNMTYDMTSVYNMALSGLGAARGSHLMDLYSDNVEMEDVDHRAMYSVDMGLQVIALPDAYLEDYFTQKASCAAGTHPQKDSPLVYNYEGQGSPVGSEGCCSLLEADNDLQFLNDLGPKFKTLAEVCGPEVRPNPAVESIAVAQVRHRTESKPTRVDGQSTVANHHTDVSDSALVHGVSTSTASHVTRHLATSSSNVTQTVPTSPVTTVTSVSGSATLPPPVQTILVQQQPPPLYYTAAPMMQPIQYIVEPQAHNTVLMAERPAAANMQNVILVGGGPGRAVSHTVQGEHPTSMFGGLSPTLERGGRVVAVEEKHGRRASLISAGQVTLDRGESVVLMGSAGLGQRILVNDGAERNRYPATLGTFTEAANIWLANGHVKPVMTNQVVCQGGLVEGAGYILVESPTSLGPAPFSPTLMGPVAFEGPPTAPLATKRVSVGAMVLVEKYGNGVLVGGEQIGQHSSSRTKHV